MNGYTGGGCENILRGNDPLDSDRSGAKGASMMLVAAPGLGQGVRWV